MSNKKPIIALIILILAVVAGYYFLVFMPEQAARAEASNVRQFVGNIISIEGSTITLQGMYGGLPTAASERLSAERKFTFQVDGATDFEKLLITLPSWDEMEEEGVGFKSYSLQELPREEGPGSLEDLKAAFAAHGPRISVDADFAEPIYGKSNIVATGIFYTIIPESQ